jgi:lipopolysaccharide transport system ATP-binding protein
MSDDVLIRAAGVSKKFCRDLKRSLWYGVKDAVGDIAGHDSSNDELRRDEFWAVDNVSFELRRGECLGLIGRNGAGKTTLLKMLNGLIKPDRGRIEMRGRVGALIALGAGFNPILTGRENIYVNGSVLGLSKKEIDAKYDEIVDFAEIGEFIDSPVQSYSSGMQVRLGFAVATALDPDVLILDEVLAVGDVVFRSKCFNRIERLRARAATVLVSHYMPDMARICTGSIVLKGGVASPILTPVEGIQLYESLLYVGSGSSVSLCEPGFELLAAGLSSSEINWGDCLDATIEFRSPDDMLDAEARVTFMDDTGEIRAEWRSTNNHFPIKVKKGLNKLHFNLGALMLRGGNYSIGFVLSRPNVAQYLILSYGKERLTVVGNAYGFSYYQLRTRSQIG